MMHDPVREDRHWYLLLEVDGSLLLMMVYHHHHCCCCCSEDDVPYVRIISFDVVRNLSMDDVILVSSVSFNFENVMLNDKTKNAQPHTREECKLKLDFFQVETQECENFCHNSPKQTSR
jgi:hypothetical protein